ncbi:MAG: DEAD/DEAH box helicase [Holophagales bacterium]|nr:DEAD/DEAH box helicase [Holophagales bacterium]MYF96003.1 DEAD/DEAH box helicase [Holophagales bacterium]
MTAIEHAVRPNRVLFRTARSRHRQRRHAARRQSTDSGSSVDAWVGDDLARCSALAALRRFGDEHPDAVVVRDSEISASHAAVAALTPTQASALNLPERPPFSLKLDVRGVIGSSGFSLQTEWQRHGLPVTTRRQGAFLDSEHGTFLIPGPLYSAVELADSFDAASTNISGHWSALARFRRLFDGRATENAVEMTPFLRNLRIFTVEALTLGVRQSADGVEFDPIPLSTGAKEGAAADAREFGDPESPLSEDMLSRFQADPRTGFSAFPTAKRSYLLGSNTYVLVDEDLLAALEVVREKQQASPEERRGFAANPGAAFAERLAQRVERENPDADAIELAEAVEERTSRVFVETTHYAECAVEAGVWERPYAKDPPDGSGDSRPEEQPPAPASELQFPSGESDPRRPAPTPRRETELGPPGKTDQARPEPPTARRNDLGDPDALLILEPRRELAEEIPWPVRLETKPYTHQIACFQWLVASWAAGQPGVLNADDQGLGKTLETLAFLAWLQDELDSAGGESADPDCRAPILVVAPTGLLRTWEAEVVQHLGTTGLFAAHRIYGPFLDLHRKAGLHGADTGDGRSRLHFEAIHAAVERDRGHLQWLLTTYQTLTNYQQSFRGLHFSTVVFDEIQMLKNPATARARAARSVQADFRIGLTGTPIENRTTDVWAVMEALAPGRLGSLRDFESRYGKPSKERLDELHHRLFEPQPIARDAEAPPLAMRRLKENVLAGLPRKSHSRYRETMPPRQAKAYNEARDLLRTGERGAAFRTIHQLRAVSLHPDDPKTAGGTTDAYIEASARLARVTALLDDLHERGERALLFIDDLDMQAFIAQWLRSRYGLKEVPIINGATPVARRHEQIRRFQEHAPESREFDIFILSPRAAGFGLTLTAATQVVHLTRWWNPAVEEQCNDRIYRIGQTRDVTVHLPMAIHPTEPERSFDHMLDELLRKKGELARSALWPPAASESELGQLVAELLGTDPTADSLHPVVRTPELICRQSPDEPDWTLVLSPPTDLEVDEVLFDDDPLKRLDGDWEIPSCAGRLHVLTADARVHNLELFSGTPLIFKMPVNWEGPGRRVRATGRGHYLVVAPEGWRRTGNAPIAPDPCGDGFLAHYFHFDAHGPLDEPQGFEECPLPSVGCGFTLEGNRVFDDAADGGLFGEPPSLKVAPEVQAAWVGMAGGTEWPGARFDPRTTELQEALGDREGSFSLRVYDEWGLRDSGRFRLLRELREIKVAGEPYTKDTLLVPGERGHLPVAVRLRASAACTTSPDWIFNSGTSTPTPDDERVDLPVATNSGTVRIVVRPPRIWWRLESALREVGRWGAEPIELTREDFLRAAENQEALVVVLPRKTSGVRVGFDPEDTRSYPAKLEDGKRLARLPLLDFRDYKAMDRPMLEETTLFVIVERHTMTPLRLREEVFSAEASIEAETSRGRQEAQLETLPTEAPDPVDQPTSRQRKGDRGLRTWTIRFLKWIRKWASFERE